MKRGSTNRLNPFESRVIWSRRNASWRIHRVFHTRFDLWSVRSGHFPLLYPSKVPNSRGHDYGWRLQSELGQEIRSLQTRFEDRHRKQVPVQGLGYEWSSITVFYSFTYMSQWTQLHFVRLLTVFCRISISPTEIEDCPEVRFRPLRWFALLQCDIESVSPLHSVSSPRPDWKRTHQGVRWYLENAAW